MCGGIRGVVAALRLIVAFLAFAKAMLCICIIRSNLADS